MEKRRLELPEQEMNRIHDNICKDTLTLTPALLTMTLTIPDEPKIIIACFEGFGLLVVTLLLGVYLGRPFVSIAWSIARFVKRLSGATEPLQVKVSIGRPRSRKRMVIESAKVSPEAVHHKRIQAPSESDEVLK